MRTALALAFVMTSLTSTVIAAEDGMACIHEKIRLLASSKECYAIPQIHQMIVQDLCRPGIEEYLRAAQGNETDEEFAPFRASMNKMIKSMIEKEAPALQQAAFCY